MSIQDYEQLLHEAIDGANNEAALRELLDTANRVLNNQDILDELSEEQLARIDESMDQIKQGRIVSNAIVRDEARQSLKRR